MHQSKIALAAVAALALTACAQPAAKPAVDTAKIADAVKADAEASVADLNAKNADKAASHVATNADGIKDG